MRDLARDYPSLFMGIVFASAAFVCSTVVGGFYLLILRSDGLIESGSGAPYDAYIFVYILFLPALISGLVGAFLGRKLIGAPYMSRTRAATTGAGIAAVSLILWAAAGELLWVWIGFPVPNPAESGVVDFLAVLGYGLMVLVFVVVTGLGAAAGVGLRSWLHQA